MSDSNIITGQYVQIDQRPAGAGDRIVAWLIDYVILFIYMYGAVNLLTAIDKMVRESDTFIIYVIMVFLPWFLFPFLCEVFSNGQSPGKWVRGIKVVNKDGTSPTMGSYFMRWLLLMVDMTAGIGLLFILLTKDKQRLGDLAAGTMVIKKANYHNLHVSLDEFEYFSPDYKPAYEQAADLSIRQVDVIEKTLDAPKNAERTRRIEQLYTKVHDMLSIPHDQRGKEEFLYQLLRDYQYFAAEMV